MLVEYSFKRSVSSWKALDIRKTLLMESCGRVILYFCSSRRRHTRWNCDWSRRVLFRSPSKKPSLPSNVSTQAPIAAPLAINDPASVNATTFGSKDASSVLDVALAIRTEKSRIAHLEIGRASCRERE